LKFDNFFSLMLSASSFVIFASCSGGGFSSGSTCSGSATAIPTGSVAAPSPYVAVSLTGCTTTDYSIPVTVGGQSLNLIADSGSTMMAVASSSCTNCTNLTTYPISHGAQSCQSVSSTYGDNSGWSGLVSQDSVVIGTLPSIKDNFASITSQSGGFFSSTDCSFGNTGTNSSQGIIGLAYSRLAQSPTVGYLDALQSQVSMTDLFATELCETGGTIWFGGYDSSQATGSAVYTPITAPAGQANEFYWVTLTDLKVGGVSIGASSSAYTSPIVDTGTSIALLPPAVSSALITKLGTSLDSLVQASTNCQSAGATTTADFFNTGCCVQATTAQVNALPALTMAFGTTTVALPAARSYLDSHLDSSAQRWYCPGFAPNASSSDPTIIGGSFMRSLITIFDRTNSRIGFVTGNKCAN
jgi:Eukaryotic aspartyl protease